MQLHRRIHVRHVKQCYLTAARNVWRTNLLSILPKSRRQLVCVKPLLQRRSTKSVYHNVLLELKLQECYDY